MIELIAKIGTVFPVMAVTKVIMTFMIVTLIPIEKASGNQSTKTSISGTASAKVVLMRAVGVQNETISYSRLAENYIPPQSTRTSCNDESENRFCIMILVEVQ